MIAGLVRCAAVIPGLPRFAAVIPGLSQCAEGRDVVVDTTHGGYGSVCRVRDGVVGSGDDGMVCGIGDGVVGAARCGDSVVRATHGGDGVFRGGAYGVVDVVVKGVVGGDADGNGVYESVRTNGFGSIETATVRDSISWMAGRHQRRGW